MILLFLNSSQSFPSRRNIIKKKKKMKCTQLVPKTFTLYQNIENVLIVKFSLNFRNKSSRSNLLVFKEELQCYFIFPRNQVFCLKRVTTQRTSNYHKRKYFVLKCSASVLLTNAFKTVFVVLYFVLVTELFPNIKIPGFYTLT